MLTTGIFTTHTHNITLEKETDRLYLPIFGDLHYGCSAHATHAFLRYLKRVKRLRGPKLCLGLGDYFDLLSTSERANHAKQHETTIADLDNRAVDLVEELGQYLYPFDWLGLIDGNHYYPFSDGTNTTHLLAQYLETVYLGCTSLIKLNITIADGPTFRIAIHPHHGKGGGAQTVGGSLQKVEKMAHAMDASLYIMGHDHQKGVAHSERLCYHKGKLRSHPIVCIRSRSF